MCYKALTDAGGNPNEEEEKLELKAGKLRHSEKQVTNKENPH